MSQLLNNQTGSYLEYCRSQKRLDPKTLKAYRIDLRQFSACFPDTDLSDIQPEQLEQYIA